MSKTIRAGVIGATGYAGAELVRLLWSHPNAELAGLSSVSYEGKPLSDVYGAYRGLVDNVLVSEDEAIEQSDIVFASLPHGLSFPIARKCVDAGKPFIDLGADFRLHDEHDYHEWYGLDYPDKELSAMAVYGLPELFRDTIASAKIIGNPGCYPTASALGIAPALKLGLASPDGLVIDAKSGVTGAGRGLSQNTHFPDCNEAFSPYKVASHRHTPEIEQTLTAVGGHDVTLTFVPHLLPLNRGIVATIYAQLTKDVDAQAVHKAYSEFYADEPFVRVLPLGDTVNLNRVQYSNLCDISLHVDRRTNRLIAVSAIDNMVKGAAGQAVQNMNILAGLPEETGLHILPPAF